MSASVRPLSKSRYEIRPSKGYRVVVIGDEALIVSDDGTETTRLKIEPPPLHHQRAIVRLDDGAIEVIYHAGV